MKNKHILSGVMDDIGFGDSSSQPVGDLSRPGFGETHGGGFCGDIHSGGFVGDTPITG